MSLLYAMTSSSQLAPELATRLVLVHFSIFHSHLHKRKLVNLYHKNDNNSQQTTCVFITYFW